MTSQLQESAQRLAGARNALLMMIQSQHELLERMLLEAPVSRADDDDTRRQLRSAGLHLEAAVAILSGQPAPIGLPEPSNARRPHVPVESTRFTGPFAEDEDELARDGEEDEADKDDGLHGHLSDGGIAEILGFIANLRKSGTLLLRGQRENFLVELRDGAVIYAQGDDPPQGLLLGEILVAQGAAARIDIEPCLKAHGNDLMLGRALMEQGSISHEALLIALSYQVQHVFHRMFAEPGAFFQFEEDVYKYETDDIKLDVQMLLLESARRRDEGDKASA